jgi:hypothetical protein
MFHIKTYALVSLIALASAAGGYAMTSSNTGLAARHVVKVDFDQTFADAAAGHRELVTTSINRTNKGDRLRIARTPKVGCEALAAPYVDLVVGRIIGRCVV